MSICFSLGKKSKNKSIPGLEDDGDTRPAPSRQTAAGSGGYVPSQASPAAQQQLPMKTVTSLRPANIVVEIKEEEEVAFLQVKDLDSELVAVLYELSAGEGRVDVNDSIKEVCISCAREMSGTDRESGCTRCGSGTRSSVRRGVLLLTRRGATQR